MTGASLLQQEPPGNLREQEANFVVRNIIVKWTLYATD